MQNNTFKNQNLLLLAYLEQIDYKAIAVEKPILNVSAYPTMGIPATSSKKELYYIFMNQMNRMEEQSYA